MVTRIDRPPMLSEPWRGWDNSDILLPRSDHRDRYGSLYGSVNGQNGMAFSGKTSRYYDDVPEWLPHGGYHLPGENTGKIKAQDVAAKRGGGETPSVSEMKAYIREQARARGIDPNIAVRVAKSEGLKPGTWQSEYYKNGRRETSYGPFQLLVGGGLGDKFTRQTGLDPADPSSWKEQIQFALDEAIKGGWGPWYGAAKVGVGKWDGLGNAQPLGITDTAAAETATDDTATAETDPFSILSPDLARPGSTRVAESAAYFPEEPTVSEASFPPAPSAGREMAAMAPQMLGAPTGLGQPIQARFDGAPPPMLGNPAGLPEPNPARFEGTPAPMLGAPAGLPEPNPARFEGTPFPSPNRMQAFGGVPTPGLTPMSLAWDPQSWGSVAPRQVQTSALGLPPSGQAVPANNFGLAHGQPGFAGGVPAREVSALFKVDGPGPRDGAFTQDAYRNPQAFEFARQDSPELAAPADARFSGPAAPKGDRLPSALPSREMFAMADAMQGAPAARPVALPGAMPDFAGVMAGKPISPGSTFGPQDVERAKANRPTDGVPYSGPGSYFTAEDVERSKLANMPPSFFEGGMHRAGLMGMPAGPDPRTPLMAAGQMRAPDLKSEPFGQVAPKSVTTSREVRAALPVARGFAPGNLGQFATALAASAPEAVERTGTTRGPSRREPVRIVNPVSTGQPGGKYGGTGLNAMMGVRSGMSPVGTVARSASNPSVMAVSLPHGNVAHVNTQHGFISTWSPADDDERGTVYGKVVAIDPTGSKYGYYSPGKAPKGWTTFGPETAPGPGKGFSKSTAGPAGSAQRGGLLGMLSGMFGQQGPGIGRGGVLGALGLHGPVGTAAGLFGPAGGMGGLGLGGAFGGGPAGGGGFGGAPGFGGAISSNNNYGGL